MLHSRTQEQRVYCKMIEFSFLIWGMAEKYLPIQTIGNLAQWSKDELSS